MHSVVREGEADLSIPDKKKFVRSAGGASASRASKKGPPPLAWGAWGKLPIATTSKKEKKGIRILIRQRERSH